MPGSGPESATFWATCVATLDISIALWNVTACLHRSSKGDCTVCRCWPCEPSMFGNKRVLIHSRCRDSDRATRKFACFAIGNAGFHSSALYEPLRASIAPLVALLRDEEDKTRANAAGALGNLVRNSSLLCRELIKAEALQASVNGFLLQPCCKLHSASTFEAWCCVVGMDGSTGFS